ncbi:thiamine phosphate synthase [Halorhodospira neutriphila]|uniref:Thiamine-phosphate synthase n=1 Tax=Halorhodospira neutriphila TaxID=168379 RepID=A0ABS1E5Y7_9GAMM|nr:thiamine phosphate synthase [Halorhodospira neutriphila]MBK1726920.1 thiamine phosphate synthase [Halorhodospira neutriphila]
MAKEASALAGIYAVTEPREDLAEAVAAALRGGVRVVQYRDKGGDHARRLAEARRLRGLCAEHGALLIVNDDPELAAEAGADGVHLGADDPDVAQARRRLGEAAWIGVSCYADLERARRLVAAGADYVAFGSVFPSPTKPESALAPLDTLAAGRRALGCPVVAIGGINLENVAQVAAAGADAAAVVSALFAADDPERAAAELVAQWRRSR